jgi:acyl-coenzyme A synthetase/AMP-(fatty) acid ligase
MILQTLFARAEAHPDRVAIDYGGSLFSYGWFARQIAARRRAFAALDLKPGAAAVVCLTSMIDAWIVCLALRSLGVTTLAVRAIGDLPDLASLDLTCVVADVAPASVPGGAKLILAPRDWRQADPAGGPFEPPTLAAPVGGHILLTSGTTGRPKMFAISAAADAVNLASHIEIAGLGEQTAMHLFAFGLWTSAGYNVAASCWCAGGRVVLDQGPGMGASLFLRPVTDAWMTPLQLAQQLSSDAVRRLDDVRLIVGGFALSRALANEAFERVTGRLSLLIAATETGPWSLAPLADADDIAWRRPHPSRQVEIVDEADRPTPVGEVGLVRIRVIDAAAGYIGAPEASAAHFRGGWFYPGDLAIAAPDGRLSLQGRATDVIHMNGGKFAAGPIEQDLRDRLGVDEVCVFSAPNAEGEEELHVVLQTTRPVTHEQLAEAIGARVSGFPSARVHRLDALPRTASGKVRRAALKAQVMGAADMPVAPPGRA